MKLPSDALPIFQVYLKDNEVNVLTKMNVGFYGGPLKRLCDWVNGKNRVKIMLRGRNRINSVVTAFITAFDKHFNLIIRLIYYYLI